MKIAISATGASLDADVDPRFGRCQYFVLVDPDTMEFESLENASVMASGGAGISAAQVIVGKGVQAVLTGNCGPNAYQVLSAAGVQVITGASGNIKDAVQAYKSGQFQPSSQPNVADHSGMGGGMGGGMGRGMGGGMGRGMGGGMGRGMGRGMGMGGGVGMMPAGGSAPMSGLEQDVEALKNQSQMLAQQLAEIQRRIDEMGNKGK